MEVREFEESYFHEEVNTDRQAASKFTYKLSEGLKIPVDFCIVKINRSKEKAVTKCTVTVTSKVGVENTSKNRNTVAGCEGVMANKNFGRRRPKISVQICTFPKIRV